MDLSPIKLNAPKAAVANEKDKEIDDLKMEIARLQNVIANNLSSKYKSY